MKSLGNIKYTWKMKRKNWILCLRNTYWKKTRNKFNNLNIQKIRRKNRKLYLNLKKSSKKTWNSFKNLNSKRNPKNTSMKKKLSKIWPSSLNFRTSLKKWKNKNKSYLKRRPSSLRYQASSTRKCAEDPNLNNQWMLITWCKVYQFRRKASINYLTNSNITKR